MLSETDIHYITGFLYLAARIEDISITLGDKVYDEASETKRDVDIVITSTTSIGLIGVEVKDMGRRLGTGIVEGICRKFEDMPSLRFKYIASSSGYTTPARRKAKRHGVQCLTIVRGRIPPFSTINLSRLDNMEVFHQEWVRGPHVIIMPRVQLSKHERSLLSESTSVSYPPEICNPKVTNLKQLADTIARSLNRWEGPPGMGDIPVVVDIPIGDRPQIHIGERVLEVTEARATGIVRKTKHIIPFDNSCYLEEEDGSPFTGAAITEFRGSLLGVCASSRNQELRAFYLPDSVRQIRPIRIVLPR
jgi:hypothetical protein